MPNPIPLTVARRRSIHRWRHLSILLHGIDRAVEATARLDARIGHAREWGATRNEALGRYHVEVDRQLLLLEHRIDRELDRLTCERLDSDLVERKKDAAVTALPATLAAA